MHYQAALSLLMQEQRISIQTLSNRTNFSVRWLSLILKDSDWNPWLNTLLKLSEALRINVIKIVEYSEVCNRQENLRTSEPQNLRTSELNITPEQISYALKAVRLEQGLSQTTLAKLTHFQLTAISLREQSRYQSYPALSTLETYCKAFGITVSSFLRYALSLSLTSEEAIS